MAAFVALYSVYMYLVPATADSAYTAETMYVGRVWSGVLLECRVCVIIIAYVDWCSQLYYNRGQCIIYLVLLLLTQHISSIDLCT